MFSSNKNQVNSTNKHINLSLNVLKCIAIFAVICIHCRLYNIGTKGEVIVALSRFAVPFFFLISGYFSFIKIDSVAVDKYKIRLIRMIKLLIISLILYFIFYDLIFNFSIPKIMSRVALNHLYEYFIFNASPNGGHLWYIEALIYCYALIYLLKKFNINFNILYVYIPILLIINLLLGEFSIFNGTYYPMYFHRNFLFTGLPFFTLGYLIHDKQDTFLTNFSNKFFICSLFLGFILTILEVLVIGTTELYVGSIILSVTLFIWCIKNPTKLDFKITGWIGGKLYTSMYILHLIVYYAIIPDFINLGYLNPFIVFFITLIISTIIYFFNKQFNIKLF